MPSPSFEVHALRYASRPGEKSDEFFRFMMYGEEDESYSMDYFFWLAQGEDHTVVVDCGFSEAQSRVIGRPWETSPAALLERMGVDPAAVEHVVLSHMHWDHVGNVDLFPRATFVISRAEYEFSVGPDSRRELMQHFVLPAEVDVLEKLQVDGRLRLIEDEAEVVPGVVVRTVGGHTPGQVITEVATDRGTAVLASDAAHFYEEIERDRPFKLFTDLPGLYHGYDLLRELDGRPDTHVVPGHDPLVRSRFAEVRPDCFDVGRPLASTKHGQRP